PTRRAVRGVARGRAHPRSRRLPDAATSPSASIVVGVTSTVTTTGADNAHHLHPRTSRPAAHRRDRARGRAVAPARRARHRDPQPSAPPPSDGSGADDAAPRPARHPLTAGPAVSPPRLTPAGGVSDPTAIGLDALCSDLYIFSTCPRF